MVSNDNDNGNKDNDDDDDDDNGDNDDERAEDAKCITKFRVLNRSGR